METKVKEIDNIKEIQTIELNILTKSVDLFNTNNISYILAGGTMLGAVRHNGFIPWDNDIDIFVPREDYDRIKDVFTAEKAANLGLSIKIPGMEEHPFPFIKIYDTSTVVIDEMISEQYPLHIWIDVFPLDHFPDSDILHRLYLFTIRIFRTALKSKTARNGLSKGNPMIQKLFDAIYELLGGGIEIYAVLWIPMPDGLINRIPILIITEMEHGQRGGRIILRKNGYSHLSIINLRIENSIFP